MQRQSEEALGLIEISDEINASIETHGVGVAKLLEEQWAPNPASETSTPEDDGPGSPNFKGNLFALKDGLAASAGDLKRDDQHHVHQLAGLMQVRQERQELTKEAREQYTAMRRSTEELYGAGQAFVLFGIEGPSSRKPNKLQRQMELSIPRLRDPNLKLPPAKVPGIEVNPVAMARGLQALVDRMSAMQAEFRRMRRIVQATRKEKNRRLGDHRKRIVRTGRIVEGYYQLAGEEELAERLRPVISRASRKVTETSPEAQSPEESAPPESAPEQEPEGETQEGSDIESSVDSPEGSDSASPSTDV